MPPPARLRGLLPRQQARHDTRTVDSSWRHLDLGRLRLVIKAKLRRIDCPTHGVRTKQVPFARIESGFTRDFEELVAWLATRMDKPAVRWLVRVAWQTVGAIRARVVADQLDPGRLDELFEVGIQEVSWRTGHRYLTLVTDHRSGKVVWGAKARTPPATSSSPSSASNDPPSWPPSPPTWAPRS